MEDIEKAATILKGHKVHEDVRVMVIPATQKIYKQCIHEGLMDIFCRCRMCSEYTELRTMYGWTYGCYGERRKVCIDNEP